MSLWSLVLVIGVAIGGFGAPSLAAGETRPAADAATPAVEQILRTVPTSTAYGEHLLLLTEEPHMAGTPRNDALADYVRDRFLEYGLDEVTFHDTPALLAFPRKARLTILGPARRELALEEAPHAADKDSRLYDDPQQIAFHGYAPSGTVSGEVVYANNGGPEDFAELDRMGVNLRGRIVMMRYSSPYSYRGYKLYMAEQRGAAGVIIYSDPRDDGHARGPVYPDGPWGPESHVQWGAILYDWLGPGEPFTFHWKQDAEGRWVEGPVRDKQLPRIPSMPLSAANAAAILAQLEGPAVPEGWQGALPFAYRVGPGPVKVRMEVVNEERVGRLRNVIGLIRGREEPEKLVILGNHRDAWSYGAVDPSSGTAALLETARALGAALKQGHRPRRSIVFANWDGEEPLLGGSTQWVKDNAARLRRDAVTYINVDSGVSGPDFMAGATPALAAFVRELTRAVTDPKSGAPLHDTWAARFPDKVPEVATIVGATDYTAFQEHLGISCIDMHFGGPYGVYHSQYDNFFWMSRFGDPGFHYGRTLAQVWGLMAWRLAEAPLLPMRYSDYARAVLDYIARVEAHAARGSTDPGVLREVNAQLLEVERALTEPAGLEGRPFVKHLLVAPQPTYRSEYLPRIWEALDRDERAAVPRYEQQLVAAFDRAAAILVEAGARLEAGAPR